MVEYKCNRCKKRFDHKRRYEEHLNKKIPCPIKKDEIHNEPKKNYCDICDRYFSRLDTLNKHRCSQIHKEAMINNSNVTNNGIINQNVGDVTIINKHYHFISPFGHGETKELTPEEKLAIFTSDTNPIVMIIIKTNLNPSTPQYHNVGYKNMNLGWGYIYNGITWEKKEIQAIMNDLLNSKRNDLLKIHGEIKGYLSEEQNQDIKTVIHDIEKNVEPRLEHEVRSKKRLVLNMKLKFSNNQHMVTNAIKESGKPVIDNYNIKTNKIGLKEGYTMEYVIEQMNQKAELEKKKINLRKEIALYVLNLIDSLNNVEYDDIVYIINITANIKEMDLIINLLGDSYCFGIDINTNIIQKQIEKQKQTDIFMETNLF